MKNVYLVTIKDDTGSKEYACHIVLMNSTGIDMTMVNGTQAHIDSSGMVIEMYVSV